VVCARARVGHSVEYHSLDQPLQLRVISRSGWEDGSKLQLDGIERGVTSAAYYHVKLEDGRTGYISAFDLVRFGTDVDPAQAAAECKRRGNPRVGMTAKQVRATCWGEPDHVDRKETARGVTERYVYDTGRVILHNGIATSVQISGTLR
jgi:hypothetical protein